MRGIVLSYPRKICAELRDRLSMLSLSLVSASSTVNKLGIGCCSKRYLSEREDFNLNSLAKGALCHNSIIKPPPRILSKNIAIILSKYFKPLRAGLYSLSPLQDSCLFRHKPQGKYIWRWWDLNPRLDNKYTLLFLPIESISPPSLKNFTLMA